MNTFTPGDTIGALDGKIMENLGEQMLPLLDMTDDTTSKNYWALMAMFGASIAAQIEAAERVGLIKFAAPAKPPAQP